MNPTNPVIQNLGEQLVGNETNVYKMVKAIYDYIIGHFAYPTQEQMEYDASRNWNLPKCPLVTIKDGYGDCDDQSLLFASLCRYAGIPAWLEVGALYDPVKEKWFGHGWANVYIPLKGKDPAICTVDCVNQEFLFRDCFRYSDWVDTGGDVTYDGVTRNNLDYYYHLFSYSSSRSSNVQESYVKISFKSSGLINKPLDNPAGKYIIPGLKDKDSGPGPILLAVSAVSGAAAALLVAGSRRRRAWD
jgi:hypothetical protein